MSTETIRGAAIEAGDMVVIGGRRVVIADVRPATHRPDVTRVLTDTAGLEHVIGTRNKFERVNADRTILLHVYVNVPSADAREDDAIAEAVAGVLEVGQAAPDWVAEDAVDVIAAGRAAAGLTFDVQPAGELEP